jgi:hypothetical protein
MFEDFTVADDWAQKYSTIFKQNRGKFLFQSKRSLVAPVDGKIDP